ncbi:MAG: replicative DNA helicase [Myxococcales bacterium]|jgi:replicative DNA helicase|nr:replicative DNA helicase [Myxococcales bacterium]
MERGSERSGRYAKDARDPASELRPAAGRIPPSDLDAEAAVLSAVMLSGEAFDSVQEQLAPEHFYSEANRRVFEAVQELVAASRPVDVVSVAAWLRDRGRLDQVGGTPYLAQLVDATPAVAHVEEHARVIREKWRLRSLIATCQRFAAEGYGDCGDVQSFVDAAEQSIFELARVQESSSVVPVREAIHSAFRILSEARQRGGGITGFETGFTELDKRTSGLHKGDLYIVAGRPGMGKTSFVLNLAANVAAPRRVASPDDPYGRGTVEMPGYGVAFFSLEMPREQLAARLLASEARVDMASIRSGQVHAEDWNRLTEAAARIGRLPMWLDDTPAISILDLRAKIRRLQAELKKNTNGPNELGLVAIDYLQLMSGRKGVSSREQEISEISRGLKQLAKEMGVPVMALSQLNRSVETRTTKDKRPQLSDLRESGAIEQDADAILFIYRDEYYFQDSPDKGIAEVIVAKQRNGPTGTCKVKFTQQYTRFDNLAHDEYDFDQLDDFSG